MKKPIKIILIVLAVIVGLFAALLIWLTATQLNVKTETAVVTRGDNSTAAFAPGDEVSILSWNIGYAGLGEESDFFMDGGKQTRAPSKAIVEKNMDGIVETVQSMARPTSHSCRRSTPVPRPTPTALRRQAACATRRSWTAHTP